MHNNAKERSVCSDVLVEAVQGTECVATQRCAITHQC